MIEVLNGLFISSYYEISEKSLEKYKITNVINLSQVPFLFRVKNLLEINIYDTPFENISKYFTKTSRFICNSLIKKENVLIYCFQGISRSPTIIIAFLIKKRHYDFYDALKLMESKISKLCINDGFICQLKDSSKI